ncbi:hypothetical protein [Pseudomonas haemolytica]|uniref:Uncharacterized protein n=1 Tax=Pseudomonas haemolytica TaxID=2600065 RepID=A0ABS1GMY7_9PSED|nr:hypothetical protein [Pseudomonas haemolytica]MBJ2245166.1 hypothetical protein [Pseudomonas haemolytica]MBJ2272502.1 hypothetical protein [Pseudomonas haemolytica]MBK3446839.1 hypothetical protein [Pseudomonas haemolytica]MBK3458334.1 hypothetical protein [Pseudomonas haemolytica]
MEKVVCSDAKDSNGKPMWILMPDGTLLLSQKAIDQGTIQHLKLSA